MFVELHMLQNFAPSNLNRDDTGAPKNCEFGGFRRARISSQCLKRATRMSFGTSGLLQPDNLAIRTRRLVDGELVPRLERAGKEKDQAHAVVEAMLSSVGIALKGENTQYLLFLGSHEIDNLERVCVEHWDELSQVAQDAGKTKKEKKGSASKAVADAVRRSLDGGRAADLALFGRMLADLPDRNRDAASQVAHAISTHAVDAESDYYTAVDDLLAAGRAAGVEDEAGAGAGMLGTIEFNSACYYRYANVDTEQLLRNLGGDEELARATILVFLQASVDAVPSGKQNSMAAHNRPSLVMTVVRDCGLQNLANAFVHPAAPSRERGLIGESVRKLAEHRARLTGMYGSEGEQGAWYATTEEGDTKSLGMNVGGVRDVFARTEEAVTFGAVG
jgi:CRISPR system Cascade subunit CasC